MTEHQIAELLPRLHLEMQEASSYSRERLSIEIAGGRTQAGEGVGTPVWLPAFRRLALAAVRIAADTSAIAIESRSYPNTLELRLRVLPAKLLPSDMNIIDSLRLARPDLLATFLANPWRDYHLARIAARRAGCRVFISLDEGPDVALCLVIPVHAPKIFDEHRKPRVLIVEDTSVIRGLLRRALPADDMDVLEAGDGHEAFRVARKELPDVILTDVLMPRMDGYEFLMLSQDDPALSPVPVFVMSVLKDRTRTLELGAADHLVKPVTPADTAACVYGRFRLPRPRPAPADSARCLIAGSGRLCRLLTERGLPPHLCIENIEDDTAATSRLERLDEHYERGAIVDCREAQAEAIAFVYALRAHPRHRAIHINALVELNANREARYFLEGLVDRFIAHDGDSMEFAELRSAGNAPEHIG